MPMSQHRSNIKSRWYSISVFSCIRNPCHYLSMEDVRGQENMAPLIHSWVSKLMFSLHVNPWLLNPGWLIVVVPPVPIVLGYWNGISPSHQQPFGFMNQGLTLSKNDCIMISTDWWLTESNSYINRITGLSLTIGLAKVLWFPASKLGSGGEMRHESTTI